MLRWSGIPHRTKPCACSELLVVIRMLLASVRLTFRVTLFLVRMCVRPVPVMAL